MVRRVAVFILLLGVVVTGQARRATNLPIARKADLTNYCSSFATPTTVSASAALTTQALMITAGAGCAWTATSNDSFITVTSGSSGTGNGTTNLSIAANAGSARVGTVNAAGTIVTISQAAVSSGCSGATSAAVVCNGFGPGMSTRAAYGAAPGTQPVIIRVDTLADTGTALAAKGDGTLHGEFRMALNYTAPRVVVFEVSGTIDLVYQQFGYDNKVDVQIFYPYLTVAGQTAPSPGITVRYGGITILSHDMLFQHFRVRPGDGGPLLKSTADHDAFTPYTLTTNQTIGYDVHDIVFDHVSASWTGGKLWNIDLRYQTNGNVTLWRCLGGEALYRAINVYESPSGSLPSDWNGSGQPSSLANPWVDHTTKLAVIQTLFAHNSGRHPEVHAGATGVWLNNIIYDWGGDANRYTWASFFYGVEDPSVSGNPYHVVTYDPWLVDIVGNNYIAGRSAAFSPLYAVGTWAGAPGSKVYLSDNATDGSRTLSGGVTTPPVMDYFNNMGFDPRVGLPAVSLSGYTILTAAAAKPFVLANAGARPLDRDSVDTRLVADVQNYTGSMISSQTTVGGWPTLATNTSTYTVPSSPNTVTGSGYTNLEVDLHSKASALEP